MLGSWSCGADTNLLGLTVPEDHKNSFEGLLDRASAAYDGNDLEEALKYARKAILLDPKSERAAVIFGFVNLALAGGDPFGLAKAMVANDKKKDAASAAPAAGESTGGATSGNSADTLSSLKTVLGLTGEELESMATKDVSDPELPVLIPQCVEDARRASKRLTYLDDAISAVCRFTDVEARVESDYRQGCESTQDTRQQPDQVHFLWAFAHLTEALAFNAVLTYGNVDPNQKKSNLELRVDKLKAVDASTPEAIEQFVASLDTISATMEAILPVSGACSEAAPTTQLRATLNDMLAVDAAFLRLPGIPAKMTAGIQKAMAKIKGAEGQTADITAKTRTMKGDFTKKMSKGLAEKIDALGANPDQPLDEDKKTALCDAFGTISTDMSVSSVCGGTEI